MILVEAFEYQISVVEAEADNYQQQADEYTALANGSAGAGEPEYFVYNENGQLIGRYDSTGTAVREYFWLGAMPVAAAAKDELYYIHSDHLGTPRAVSKSNGAVIWSWISDAFGDSEPNEDPDRGGEAFTLNLRFSGQYYDAETGFHQNWHRDYDPASGRYVTSDPVGLDGGDNTYIYAYASPVNLDDPLGLSPTAWMTEELAKTFAAIVHEGGRGLEAGTACARTFCQRGAPPLTRDQARAECILNLERGDAAFGFGVMSNCTDVCIGITSDPRFKDSCNELNACNGGTQGSIES